MSHQSTIIKKKVRIALSRFDFARIWTTPDFFFLAYYINSPLLFSSPFRFCSCTMSVGCVGCMSPRKTLYCLQCRVIKCNFSDFMLVRISVSDPHLDVLCSNVDDSNEVRATRAISVATLFLPFLPPCPHVRGVVPEDSFPRSIALGANCVGRPVHALIRTVEPKLGTLSRIITQVFAV